MKLTSLVDRDRIVLLLLSVAAIALFAAVWWRLLSHEAPLARGGAAGSVVAAAPR